MLDFIVMLLLLYAEASAADPLPIAKEITLLSEQLPFFGTLVAVYVGSVVSVFAYCRWEHHREVTEMRRQFESILYEVKTDMSASRDELVVETSRLQRELRTALDSVAKAERELLEHRINLAHLIQRNNPNDGLPPC